MMISRNQIPEPGTCGKNQSADSKTVGAPIPALRLTSSGAFTPVSLCEEGLDNVVETTWASAPSRLSFKSWLYQFPLDKLFNHPGRGFLGKQ